MPGARPCIELQFARARLGVLRARRYGPHHRRIRFDDEQRLLLLHAGRLHHAGGQCLRELGDPRAHELSVLLPQQKERAMRKSIDALAACLFLAPLLRARPDGESTIWSCVVPQAPDSGWVVQFPTGSSDYFSAAYAAVTTLNVEGGTVSKALPIKSVGVSVADFSSGHSYPTIGVFRPNVGLDASGNTPDLSSPVATPVSTP